MSTPTPSSPPPQPLSTTSNTALIINPEPKHDTNPTPKQKQTSSPPKLPSRPRKLPKLTLTQTRTRPLTHPNELTQALTHLSTSDPTLTPLISLYQPPTFDPVQPPFLSLTKSILYQQLAYKAGTCIYSRFVALCGGHEAGIVPDTVLGISPAQLRQIGVSQRKAGYLHDLARKFSSGILSDKIVLSLDDKSLFTMLTMVNGIGSWSVHMFMIFSLHRPDVLPVNDLQVRKGVQMLYGLEELPKPSQMEQLCEKWRPYRSVGAWYMWRLVEDKGSSGAGGGGGSVGTTNGETSVSLPHPRPEAQPMLMLPEMQAAQQAQNRPHFVDPNGVMSISSNYAQLN